MPFVGLKPAKLTPLPSITTTSHLTKGLAGNVVFTAPQYVSGGFWYMLNGGTITLSAGDNTLYPGIGIPGAQQNMSVANNTVLDLNGSAQLVGVYSTPNNNNYSAVEGVITSTAPALFATRTANNGTYWLGTTITGAVTTVFGGVNGTRYLFSDNTYTGRTAITRLDRSSRPPLLIVNVP